MPVNSTQNILFFSDDTEFSLADENRRAEWLNLIASIEGERVESINVVFTSDEKLLEINRQFLNHDFYTDIITFQEEPGMLNGEIYISIDRVRENANDLDVSFESELDRVLAHGILHMAGYNDKSEEEQLRIREKEDFYLTLRAHSST